MHNITNTLHITHRIILSGFLIRQNIFNEAISYIIVLREYFYKLLTHKSF